MSHTYRLIVSCPDRVGIVARVSGFIAEHGGSILEAAQHSDVIENRFFMRYEIAFECDAERIRQGFAPTAEEFGMKWRLHDVAERPRVVVMVSKMAHCLVDLLYQNATGELPGDIVAVISNHDDLRGMTEWHDIPFHHVAVDKDNKQPAFDEVAELVDSYNCDTLVLARYMQILPPVLCERYRGRVINIHHSFLPSFVGARPYHQAYDRGVKLIGATCHYVTEVLDAGPIIEQDIQRVTHTCLPDDLVRLGRDVERRVLTRGLHWHLEDRVLLNGNRTVVFS
ncbi:formyltetrahydrofolate deformylase [Zymobacter sp. IVIA_5232.4 C2]|uniref:formyltetrahydrofolate deformylase n=1 Tax=Zymobacter sp. IVIA_5232.4 C2 TaxID=3394855 RepID=UPI0039C38A41